MSGFEKQQLAIKDGQDKITPVMNTMNFEIVAEAGQLPLFRARLQKMLEESGVSGKMNGEILVAVQEALTNIVRHAYDGKPGKIEISYADHEDRVEISFRDFGKPFDPSKLPPPELPPSKPGGLGVYLIRTLMDKADYQCRGGEGNTLCLVKYKHKPQERR